MFGRKRQRIRELEQSVQALREALLWYAAKETWRRVGIHPKGSPRKQWRKSPAAFDRGASACNALNLVDVLRTFKPAPNQQDAE